MAAAQAARGGTLCVRRRRMPPDFPLLVALVRDPTASVQLIVCADARFDTDPFLALPVPIRVPSLYTRVGELPRIVDEYALDALRALGADDTCFTAADRTWVLDHAAATLLEIEKATLRRVALRMSKSISRAAELLGMSTVFDGGIGAVDRPPPGNAGPAMAPCGDLGAGHPRSGAAPAPRSH